VHEQISQQDGDDSDDDDNAQEFVGLSFMVLFYDLQDSKQAEMELSNIHPWGPGVVVKFCPRQKSQRKQVSFYCGLHLHLYCFFLPKNKINQKKTKQKTKHAYHSTQPAGKAPPRALQFVAPRAWARNQIVHQQRPRR